MIEYTGREWRYRLIGTPSEWENIALALEMEPGLWPEYAYVLQPMVRKMYDARLQALPSERATARVAVWLSFLEFTCLTGVFGLTVVGQEDVLADTE